MRIGIGQGRRHLEPAAVRFFEISRTTSRSRGDSSPASRSLDAVRRNLPPQREVLSHEQNELPPRDDLRGRPVLNSTLVPSAQIMSPSPVNWPMASIAAHS